VRVAEKEGVPKIGKCQDGWLGCYPHYSAPDRGAEYCDERVYVCVCLSAIISWVLHVRSSPNVLCMLPMVVARSCPGGVVIHYVLPVYG